MINVIELGGGGGVTAHGDLTGLAGDHHPQYPLSAGRAGGQTITGGTAAGNNLSLSSTSNVAKGKILLGANSAYDEITERLGLGLLNPTAPIHVAGAGNSLRFVLDPLPQLQFSGASRIFYFGLDGDYNPVLAAQTNHPLILATNNTERVRITDSGNVVIGASDATAKLDINSDILRLRTVKTPSSASAAGNQGDICWDANYMYVCVATNTWKRSALATW